MDERSFAGWPADARGLVEQAVARHGGWDLYHRLRSVSATLIGLGGPLPLLKGLGRTHPMPTRATVFPHEQRTVLHDYPRRGEEGVFERGAVRLLEGKVLLTESRDHRARFSGLRKLQRWDELDALYFFGYALSNYLALPFLLAQASFVAPVRAGELRGVTVDLPPGLHTHSGRQRFYFDASGLLRRHDYTAEIVGAWARGAHFSDDYVDAGGLQVATRRHVVGALLGRPTPVPVLKARLADPRVTLYDRAA